MLTAEPTDGQVWNANRGAISLRVRVKGKPAPSSGVSETHPLAQTLARTIATVTGNSPVFQLCPGLLETRWYTQQGIPAFACGPGLLTVSHGPHEYIPVKNIAESALIYAMTAVQLLRS